MPEVPIISYLKKGDPKKGDVGQLLTPFIAITAVWIVFLIFSLLGCLCYICCCCCDKCCPPSECCRRDYDKKPITKCELNFCLIMLIIFSAPLFVVGIWGIASSSEIPDSIGSMQCALVSFPYNLMYGVDTNNGGRWIGMTPLADELETVSSGLVNKINSIND